MDTTVATSMAVSAGRGGAGGGGGDGAGGGGGSRRRSIGPAGRGWPSSATGRGDVCGAAVRVGTVAGRLRARDDWMCVGREKYPYGRRCVR